MEENREISYIVRMLLTTIRIIWNYKGADFMRPFSGIGYGSDFGILAAAVICVYGLYGRKKQFFNRDGNYICRIVRFEFWHFKSRILPHL